MSSQEKAFPDVKWKSFSIRVKRSSWSCVSACELLPSAASSALNHDSLFLAVEPRVAFDVSDDTGLARPKKKHQLSVSLLLSAGDDQIKVPVTDAVDVADAVNQSLQHAKDASTAKFVSIDADVKVPGCTVPWTLTFRMHALPSNHLAISSDSFLLIQNVRIKCRETIKTGAQSRELPSVAVQIEDVASIVESSGASGGALIIPWSKPLGSPCLISLAVDDPKSLSEKAEVKKGTATVIDVGNDLCGIAEAKTAKLFSSVVNSSLGTFAVSFQLSVVQGIEAVSKARIAAKLKQTIGIFQETVAQLSEDCLIDLIESVWLPQLEILQSSWDGDASDATALSMTLQRLDAFAAMLTTPSSASGSVPATCERTGVRQALHACHEAIKGFAGELTIPSGALTAADAVVAAMESEAVRSLCAVAAQVGDALQGTVKASFQAVVDAVVSVGGTLQPLVEVFPFVKGVVGFAVSIYQMISARSELKDASSKFVQRLSLVLSVVKFDDAVVKMVTASGLASCLEVIYSVAAEAQSLIANFHSRNRVVQVLISNATKKRLDTLESEINATLQDLAHLTGLRMHTAHARQLATISKECSEHGDAINLLRESQEKLTAKVEGVLNRLEEANCHSDSSAVVCLKPSDIDDVREMQVQLKEQMASLLATQEVNARSTAAILSSLGETSAGIARVLSQQQETSKDIALILRKQGSSEEQIALALKAIDETTLGIGKLLRSHGASHEKIGSVLLMVGETSDAVQRTLLAVGATQESIDNVLGHLEKTHQVVEALQKEQKQHFTDVKDSLDNVHQSLRKEIKNLAKSLAAPHAPTPVRESIYRSELVELLETFNQNVYKFMPFFVSDAVSAEDRHFEVKFAPIAVYRRAEDSSVDRPITYNQPSDAWNDSRRRSQDAVVRVLLEATAGSGKSTLVKWFARNASKLVSRGEGHLAGVVVIELLQLEQALLHAPADNTIENKWLKRMLSLSAFSSLFDSVRLDAVVDALVAAKEDILYIFDGFDEVQHTSCKSLRLLLHLLHDLAHPDVAFAQNVIVTSRSERVKDWRCDGRPLISLFCGWQLLQLRRWAPNVTEAYVNNFPRLDISFKNKANSLLSFPSFDLFDGLPLVVHLVCCVALDIQRQQLAAQSDSNPHLSSFFLQTGDDNTQASPSLFFDALIESILKWKARKKYCADSGNTSAELDVTERVRVDLDTAPQRQRVREVLSKTAYECALRSAADLVVTDEQCAMIVDCGVVEKLSGEANHFKFLHKTLLEYLAASHICGQLTATPPSSVPQQGHHRLPLTQSVVWFFVADVVRSRQNGNALCQMLLSSVGDRLAKALVGAATIQLRDKTTVKLNLCDTASSEHLIQASPADRIRLAEDIGIPSVLTFVLHIAKAIKPQKSRPHEIDPDGTHEIMKRFLSLLPGFTKMSWGRKLPGKQSGYSPAWTLLLIEPAARIGALYALRFAAVYGGRMEQMRWAALDALASRREVETVRYLTEDLKIRVTIEDAVYFGHTEAVRKLLSRDDSIADLRSRPIDWASLLEHTVRIRDPELYSLVVAACSVYSQDPKQLARGIELLFEQCPDMAGAVVFPLAKLSAACACIDFSKVLPMLLTSSAPGRKLLEKNEQLVKRQAWTSAKLDAVLKVVETQGNVMQLLGLAALKAIATGARLGEAAAFLAAWCLSPSATIGEDALRKNFAALDFPEAAVSSSKSVVSRLTDVIRWHGVLVRHTLLSGSSQLKKASYESLVLSSCRSDLRTSFACSACWTSTQVARLANDLVAGQGSVARGSLPTAGRAAALAVNKKYVAVSASKGNIDVIEVRTGAKLATLTGHTSAVSQLLFSTTQGFLYSASEDSTVRCWSMVSLNLTRIVPVATLKVSDFVVSMACAGEDVFVVCRDSSLYRVGPSGSAALTFVPGSLAVPNTKRFPVTCACASRSNTGDTQLVMSWKRLGASEVSYVALDGTTLHPSTDDVVSVSCDSVQTMAVSHSGDMLALGSWDNSHHTFGALRAKSQKYHKNEVRAVAFNECDSLLAVASVDKSVSIWDSRIGALLQVESCGSPPVSIGFHENCTVLVGTEASGVVFVDTTAAMLCAQRSWHIAPVELAFEFGGSLCATSTSDCIKLWDCVTHDCLMTIYSGEPVGDMSLLTQTSESGTLQLLAVKPLGGSNRQVRHYSVATGELITDVSSVSPGSAAQRRSVPLTSLAVNAKTIIGVGTLANGSQLFCRCGCV